METSRGGLGPQINRKPLNATAPQAAQAAAIIAPVNDPRGNVHVRKMLKTGNVSPIYENQPLVLSGGWEIGRTTAE